MYQWIVKITADSRRLKFAGRCLLCLPSFMVLLLCRMAGRLLYLLDGDSRKQILNNMHDVLGKKGQRRVTGICLKYYINLFITLYEILVESDTLEVTIEQKFKIEGESCLKAALSLNKGAILYTPHLGNFFYYYWYLSKKFNCLTVVTAGSPELRPLYLKFQELGCRGLDYDATPPLVLMRALRAHLKENGVVLLMGDFWRPNFPPSVFFGRRSRSPGGAAALALENQVPVVPFFGQRVRGFRHRLFFGPPVLLHKEFERHQRNEAVNRLNRFLERVISGVPDQWFYWFNVHERWEPDAPRVEAQPGGATVA